MTGMDRGLYLFFLGDLLVKFSYSLLIMIVLLLSSGCTTSLGTESEISRHDYLPDEERISPVTVDQLSLKTFPDKNYLYIAAVSPRFRSETDEKNYALANAARQISIFHGAQISYQEIIDENIIGTFQDRQVNISYDIDLALSYIKKLEIVDSIRGNDFYSALFRLEADDSPQFPHINISENVAPSWIDNPPQVNGYITGVGISQRRKSVYMSWEQSDKMAMGEIANSLEMSILSGTATIERGGTASSASTSVNKTLSTSDIYINGIYIVSRWREPDESFYYSLAIAEKP